MLAHHNSAAALTLTASLPFPTRPAGPRKQKCRSGNTRENFTVRAATLQDLTLVRTEQRSFAQPAAEDFLQHPQQLLDGRQQHLQQTERKTESSSRLFRCEASRSPLKVAVLLSGGVDSSCALHLLKKAGHHVTAFYLQIWFQEDFRNYWDQCPWEDDLDYCQKVGRTWLSSGCTRIAYALHFALRCFYRCCGASQILNILFGCNLVCCSQLI